MITKKTVFAVLTLIIVLSSQSYAITTYPSFSLTLFILLFNLYATIVLIELSNADSDQVIPNL